MILFELDNNRVTFAPQALELKPFKALWDRDTTSDKKHAVAELSYVYFFSDYKSPFSNIVDEETRKEEIISVLPNFKLKKADTVIEQACIFYSKIQNTISMGLLIATRLGVDKIKEFFINFDLRKMDKNGRPVYNPKQINDIIRDIGRTVGGLKDVEEQVMKELEVKNSMRGTREKTLFEDGELGTDL
jgi:hypothetical protein